MKPIGEFFINRKEFTPPEKPARSQRAEVTKSLYEIYTSPVQRVIRKKDNWKRYIEWAKARRIPYKELKNHEHIAKFKKSRDFIKELPIQSFCVCIARLKVEDLHYALSIGKDHQARKTSFGAWLFSSI